MSIYLSVLSLTELLVVVGSSVTILSSSLCLLELMSYYKNSALKAIKSTSDKSSA